MEDEGLRISLGVLLSSVCHITAAESRKATQVGWSSHHFKLKLLLAKERLLHRSSLYGLWFRHQLFRLSKMMRVGLFRQLF